MNRRGLIAGGAALLASPLVIGVGRATCGPLINLITHGDSITAGQGAGVAYGTILSAKLGANVDEPNANTNIGHGGTGYIQNNERAGFRNNLVQDFPISVLPMISGSLPNWLITFAGVNDLWVGGYTPAATYSAFQSYCAAAIRAGVRASRIVACCTLPSSTGRQTVNDAYNALLVGDGGGIGYKLARLDLDPRIGIAGSQSNLTYFQADQTHPTAAAQEIIAEIVCRTMFP